MTEQREGVMTYTPGPWHICYGGNGGWLYLEAEDTLIAELFIHTETDANARLIAAAPEMLEALKAVMDEYRDGYGLNCVNQVKAAITKATLTENKR